MRTDFSADELREIPQILSMPRFQRYLAAAQGDPENALRLYQWNSQLAAAFLYPLHVCEVALRNCISDAIVKVYGESWPWSESFLKSLPEIKGRNYSPKDEIVIKNKKHESAGKVIADMNFAFWLSMLTSRHDSRLWGKYFKDEFVGYGDGDVGVCRANLYSKIDKIKAFRNRVVHHEPIFLANSEHELNYIISVIGVMCKFTAEWVERTQSVRTLLDADPRKMTTVGQ